jgi:hypothetical protein
MVRLALFVACFLPLSVCAGLKTEADKRELVLGEAATVTIRGPVNSLDALDIVPLNRDFEIRSRSLSRGEADEVLTLVLYPLHAGMIALPVLESKAGRTLALKLNVLEESEALPRIRWRAAFEPAVPKVREPLHFVLEACDDGSLEWKRPLLRTLAGLHLRDLGEEQTEVERDGVTCTAHRWHWALQALSPGMHNLPLPMIEAGKFGQNLRYVPPVAAFNASPIPAWLPEEAAIGRPRIQAPLLPREWPLQRPLARRIEVDGGYSPTAIKQLLNMKLAAHPAFSAYPPAVEILPQDSPGSPNIRLAVTLYVVPHATGELAFPELVFPYLDPASGRLETLRLAGGQVEIFNPLHAKLWRAGGFLLALLVLVVAGGRLKKAINWRRARRQGLSAVVHANDLATLNHGVRSFSLVPGSNAAPTLGAWQERMEDEARCEECGVLVARLQQACYGPANATLEDIRNLALTILTRTRPR